MNPKLSLKRETELLEKRLAEVLDVGRGELEWRATGDGKYCQLWQRNAGKSLIECCANEPQARYDALMLWFDQHDEVPF